MQIFFKKERIKIQFPKNYYLQHLFIDLQLYNLIMILYSNIYTCMSVCVCV